jgi:hypothetical protein
MWVFGHWLLEPPLSKKEHTCGRSRHTKRGGQDRKSKVPSLLCLVFVIGTWETCRRMFANDPRWTSIGSVRRSGPYPKPS